MAPTILVTGATGALGTHLVRELRDRGYQVRCQYRTRFGTVEGCEWRQVDFLESPDFSALVAGCDAVIHLAAETNHGSVMYRVNVEATGALLAAAQLAGVRYFGYASSIVVYGSPRQRVVDETTPLLDLGAALIRQYHADPLMLEYARTKVLAERTIEEYCPKMAVDIYRPSVVVDVNRALEVGNWNSVRKAAFAYRQTQYIYVLDVTAAILHLLAQALGSPQVSFRIEAYNVCDEDCGTFREILTMAKKVTGNPRHRMGAGLPMAILADLTKDMLKYRDPSLRYTLGMLQLRNLKLLGTGFVLPYGIKAVLSQALGGGTGNL
jgi:nucleoside-diphosphate-sugar epimerase